MDVSSIILAGGKSTRLGRNKIAELIGKRSLIERVISSLLPLNGEIIIVTSQNSSLPELGQYPGLKVVKDIYPGKGSLGGIYTGLVNSNTLFNLVVAGDMPFINLDLLRYMLKETGDFDIVVPRMEGTLEPLHAIYAKSCIAHIESLIKQNDLRIFDFYNAVKVRYVEREEIDKIDPNHLSFFNINTESELNAGIDLAGKEDVASDKR